MNNKLKYKKLRDVQGNVMAVYEKKRHNNGNEELALQEQHIYGSSRLGMRLPNGDKNYELTNHLGNVLAVISDTKNADGTAKIVSATDYYPFGMQMPGREYSGEEYRYGFNGKEKDPEGLGGSGSTYDYGFRIYNPNIARFLSVDPLTKEYPELTPYQFSSNRPIDGIDLDGLEYYSVHVKVQEGQAPVIKIFDYTKTKQGYGSKGPGVEYRITPPNGFEVQRFEKNMYGVYQGGDNPKKYWEAPDTKGNYPDWYGLSPIDETDANAKQHDLDYDKVNAAGFWGGVMVTRTTDADEAYIERANRTIEKYKSGENDDITGVPVTEEAKNAARKGKWFFSGVSVKNIPTTVGNAIDNAVETVKEIPFKIEQSAKEIVNPANYY